MRYQQTNERRAVILMVVLSLLTLFALVGITFVLYADAEAAAARVAREAETAQRADMDPQRALAFILGQIIYDVNDNDTAGWNSGLRGHSLARTMYGSNSAVPGSNIAPYGGVGRVHTNGVSWPYQNTLLPLPAGIDDYLLVNYTWFQTDGFARDPEWFTGTPQTTPGYPKSATTYYVGGNAPYTYPDLNSFFLAAVRSDGTVMTPSFHRPWLFQLNPTTTPPTPYTNPATGLPYAFNDPKNPNWTSPWGKYLTLRPRPFEHPAFPMPDDPYGDVRNLPWSKTNDSIWIDPGGPVMTAPDGTLYKMLVAPCIIDLDNRINVGTAGNIEGGNTVSRSNQGWFPSEVNLSALWSNAPAAAQNEWLNLFLGNPPGTPPATPSAGYYGKYGKSLAPGGYTPPQPNPTLGGVLFPNGSPAHFYAQADLDGRNEMAAGAATTGVTLPTPYTPANPNPCFPTFPVGYGSGSGTERAYHPGYYDVYKSSMYNKTNDNLVFQPTDMEALLRPISLTGNVDANSSALISNLMRLCPTTLGGTNPTVPDTTAAQRRNWITTVSTDLARPGLSPWIYNPADPTSSMYLVNAGTPSLPPQGMIAGNPNPYISFTTFKQRMSAVPTPPVGSEYTPSWQSTYNALGLGRVDLNRPLPSYPHMASGATPMMTNTPNDRYDLPSGSFTLAQIQAQYLLANGARQQLAIDIYLRLLAITGVAPPSNQANPTAADLAPRRWLAQLAANIVDYIDDDEISTPFNFYNPANPLGLPTLGNYNYQVTPTSTAATDNTNTIPVWSNPPYQGNPDVPTYWVFGTELPRLVINEALGEYTYNPNPPNNNQTVNVNVWVELYNPLPSPAAVTAGAAANGTVLQPQDSMPVPLYYPVVGTTAPLYNPYQLVIANNSTAANSYSLWTDTITGGMNNNVLGTAQQIRYSVPPTAAAPNGTPAICNFLEGNGTVYTASNPTTASYSIAGPGGGLPGQSFMLVGPSASGNAQPYNDAKSDITAANITAAGGNPAAVPWLQSPLMTYQVKASNGMPSQWSMAVPPPPGSPPNTPPGSINITDNNTNGILVLLRRLANPHLPPNLFTPAGTLANPALPPNPYITVDYSPFKLNGYDGTQTPPAALSPPASSFGKREPYSAINSPQTNANLPNDQQTLGAPNSPLNTPFNWLVHLDRALISPMELLHVSGFAPYLLTQRFVQLTTLPGGGANPLLVPQPYTYTPAGSFPGFAVSYFQHYVPWFDQSRRLYRFLELVDTRNGAAGISPVNGRVPGKININTLWDLPTTNSQLYQAIADPPQNAANADNPNFTAANVTTIFQSLLTARTPGLATPALGAADQPFVGMAAGVAPVAGADPQYPNGMGINHTLLMDNKLTDALAAPTNQRLLQLNSIPANLQTAHPYLQNELLTKIYSRLTTRSNVYAVFLTVGFFQVTGTVTGSTMPQLGAEIGRSEGRQIRHRMFAIVDRSNLTLSVNTPALPLPFPTLTGAAIPPNPVVAGNGITVATGSPPLLYQFSLSTTGSKNPFTGATWAIGPFSQVVFEPGTDNEETVTLQAAATPGQFTAVFYKSHSSGVPVVLRGNPGPWIVPYDPRLDAGVVLYYSIID